MTLPIKFVSGIEPQDPRARGLAQAEKRSHAAKVGHQRLRQTHQINSTLLHSRSTVIGQERPTADLTSPNPGWWQSCAHAEPAKGLPTGLVQYQAKLSSRWKRVQNAHNAHMPDIHSRHPHDEVQKWPDRSRPEQGHKSTGADFLPLRRPPTLFKSPESARLLQFWLLKAAPFMTRGRHNHQGVLEVLVPQNVCQSVIINQVMMAHALTHWTLIQTTSERRVEGGRQALWHYTAAITEMRRHGATPVEALLLSYLGWTIEGLQGNMARSQIHLKGLKALVCSLGDEDKEIRQSFEPMLMNAEAVQSIVINRAKSDRSFVRRPQPMPNNQRRLMERLGETGPTIRWIFCYILGSRQAATNPEAIIHDGVSAWLNTHVMQHPLWEQGTNQASADDILQMFADGVVTLLPHHAVADLSPADTISPEAMVEVVEKSLRSIIQTSCGDEADLMRSLRLIVELCVKIWSTEPWLSQMQGLARAVDLLEKEAFWRQGFLTPEHLSIKRFAHS